MHSTFTGFPHRIALLLVMLMCFGANALCQVKTRDRILQTIDEANISPVINNVSPRVRPGADQGRVRDSLPLNRVTLIFKPTKTQQDDLNALLVRQQDPNSPDYHKWLTPDQYAERFGLSQTDFGKIATWLQTHGLTVVDAARGRTSIAFSGTAAQVASAFHTEIHHYVISGELHYANTTAPSIPNAFAGLVLAIRHLDDFRPKPRAVVIHAAQPGFTSSVSGNHFLAPNDFATIYNLQSLYSSGIDGTGQKLAIVGQTDVVLSDIATFRSVSNLPKNTPQVILVPGSADPGVVSGDIVEANLDLEWAGAVARNATLIYVNSGNGAIDALQYAVDQNVAPVISTSYGDCEQNLSSSEISALAALGQRANVQGQTILAATGDTGAADCDFSSPTSPTVAATQGLAVDVPASLPFITGVGGSEFNEGSGSFWSSTNNVDNGSALSYIPESSWNDTALTGHLSSGGGGASTVFPKPAWQVGLGVPADGARDVPDVSFSASAAHDGYLICSQGSCVNGYRALDNSLTVVGGTSVAAPAFAGIVALVNQKMQSAHGNINPILYSLAADSPDAFHDNVTGDNRVPCVLGSRDCTSGGLIGYDAGVGYDLATGLGSVNAFNLVNDWGALRSASPDFQIVSAVQNLQVRRGGSGSASIVITALNGFSGSVALTCAVSASLGATTCSVNPRSTTGGVITLSVTAPVQIADGRPLQPHSLPGWEMGSGLLLAAGLTLMGRAPTSEKRRLRAPLVALVILTLICVIALVGCGGASPTSNTLRGGGSSSTPVTGSVTVQATSGALAHTAVVAVTVN